jgi:hypothetical protein
MKSSQRGESEGASVGGCVRAGEGECEREGVRGRERESERRAKQERAHTAALAPDVKAKIEHAGATPLLASRRRGGGGIHLSSTLSLPPRFAPASPSPSPLGAARVERACSSP